MHDTPPRAAIYARISKRDPRVPKVDNQIAECRAIAEANGYEVAEVYVDDGISASAFKDRPGWLDLLSDIEAREFDVLLAQAEDRFTRQPMEKEQLTLLCGAGGVVWHTVVEGRTDPATADGAFFATMRGALARMEASTKSKRQKLANKHRVELGRVYGRRPAWGWKDLGCHELDLKAARLIHVAVEDILRGKSTTEVAAEWNARGVTAPGGGDWLATTVRKTLLRPQNAGIAAYHDELMSEIETHWTPIFDRATYDALVTILKERGRSSGAPVRSSSYLMRGLVTCGKCGSPLAGTRQKSIRYPDKPADRNYLCQGRTHNCYRAIRADALDAFAIHYTAQQLLLRPPESYMPEVNLARLARIDGEIARLDAELEVLAQSGLDMSSKIALAAPLDSAKIGLRAEIAELTRGNAITSMLRELVPLTGRPLEEITFDENGEPVFHYGQESSHRVSLDHASERTQQIEGRLRNLSISQQRAIVREFATYVVLDRNAKPRVQVDETNPHADWPDAVQ